MTYEVFLKSGAHSPSLSAIPSLTVTQERNFMVFAGFQQTMKVFFTNFISAILSVNIYAKSCSHFCQKQNHKSFCYIMIKSNELRNSSLVDRSM